MAGALAVHFAGRQIGVGLGDLDVDAVFLGGTNPGVHVTGLRRRQFGVLAQPGQCARLFGDNRLQGASLDLQIALGGNFLSVGEVEACLRFMRIGNRCRADLETLLGEFQLLNDGRLVGAHCGQVLAGVEYVEIGLGCTQDQILTGLSEVGFGLCNLQLRLVVGNPVLPAEERLAQRQLITVAVETGLAERIAIVKGNVVLVPHRVARQCQAGQQAGAALRQFLAAGFRGIAGGGEGRIVVLCVAINLHQVSRMS